MGRRATIIDIAHAAGVSKSTVSLVLTGGKVKSETAEVVREAMGRLGYVYHRGAASLRGLRSRIVGMVINDLSNPFFAELAIGIERGLRASGTIPFMANTAESVLRQAEVVRSMREHGAAGIILCPAAETSLAEIEALAAMGVPIVLTVRRVPGARVSLVVSDNRAGAARVTRHLLGLGHRQFAFIGGLPGLGVREDRVAGFGEALAAAGVGVDPAALIESAPTREGGFAAVSALLARKTWPRALVCFNDVVAIGAMMAITRHGLEPGRDIAVAGFDDTTEARQVSPPLTTVSVGAGDLGERAAAMLLRQIETRGTSPETFVGEARLVVRASCGGDIARRKIA